MKELIEYIWKSLVDNPDKVSVTEVEREQRTVFQIRVASSDLGKIIGKQGTIARAIRTILSASGTKIGRRYFLEIVE